MESELAWNDPCNKRGWQKNSRGAGVYSFGVNITTRFLQRNYLSHIVRGHQVGAGQLCVQVGDCRNKKGFSSAPMHELQLHVEV